MTNYDKWKLLVGDRQKKEWNNRNYQFFIGANQQEEMTVIDSLRSQTPIRNFLEKSVDDVVIRTLAFLSYYNINPTFNNENNEVGTGFFWFPLDHLNDERYNNLSSRVEEGLDSEDEEESDDDEEEADLPDFPVMSTVSEPVIEAAVSDSYTSNIERESATGRKERLQQEIKEKKREKVEEFEEWLEEGFTEEPYPKDLSVFAEVVGRLPAFLLLKLIKEERERIENIYTVFSNIRVYEDEDYGSGPEFLLQRLNSLADEYPVFDSPAIEAFCLDEYDKQCSYHVTKSRGKKLGQNLDTCEDCPSELFRLYRTGLDESVKDAWMMGLLPELVVARLLAEAEWTDEVLPHRMVQMEQDDGEMSSSVEMDVSVRTKSDEVLFFEVTSQTNGALSRVMSKRDKLEDNGISYDGLVQVAPISNEEIVPFDDRVVSIGGWMIRGLETPGFRESLADEISCDLK